MAWFNGHCGVVSYSMVWYGMRWCDGSVVWYGVVEYDMVWYGKL